MCNGGLEGAAFSARPLPRSRSLEIRALWFGVLPESGGPSSEIRALRVWVLGVCPSSEIRAFRGLGSGGPSSEIRPLRSWVLGVLSQRLGLSGDWDLPGRDGESQEAL